MVNDKSDVNNECGDIFGGDDGLGEEFLFNEKDFNTIIIEQKTSEDNSKKQVLDIDKFIQQYQNATKKNDLLRWLKQNNYSNLLIEQIQSLSDDTILSQIIAVYWEAGFDNSEDLLIFIPHLLSKNFNVALEAYTAIIQLSKPFDREQVQVALQIIENEYLTILPVNINFVNEVIDLLKSEISSDK